LPSSKLVVPCDERSDSATFTCLTCARFYLLEATGGGGEEEGENRNGTKEMTMRLDWPLV
jgi:hypothetical protein